MALSLVLVQINRRRCSPLLAIVNRWLRWGIFATGAAYIWWAMELTEHPYWMLVLVFALVWFLGETLYSWLAIKAISQSPLPLFPHYAVNASGEEWPVQPHFLKMREEIRHRNFKHIQSLRAELVSGVYLRSSVFHDYRDEMRLQVTFLPQTNGTVSMCMGFSSLTTSGYRYATDNFYLPYAGFYPETWLVERNPWKRSFQTLFHRHNERLAKGMEALLPWTTEPLDDLNTQQRELEQLNVEFGFLTQHADREELGKVTAAGRYRLWKEIWTLNYFGRSVSYL